MDKITFFDRLGEILDRVMSFTVGSLTLGNSFPPCCFWRSV